MRIRRFFLAVTLTFAVLLAWAQPGAGDPGPKPGTDPEIPLGGLEYLLAAGGLLGIKKIRDYRKKDSE